MVQRTPMREDGEVERVVGTLPDNWEAELDKLLAQGVARALAADHQGAELLRVNQSWVAGLYDNVPRSAARLVTLTLTGEVGKIHWVTPGRKPKSANGPHLTLTGDKAYWESLDFPVSINKTHVASLLVAVRVRAV